MSETEDEGGCPRCGEPSDMDPDGHYPYCSSDCFWESMSRGGSSVMCSRCEENEAKDQTGMGLDMGIVCDDCWEEELERFARDYGMTT